MQRQFYSPRRYRPSVFQNDEYDYGYGSGEGGLSPTDHVDPYHYSPERSYNNYSRSPSNRRRRDPFENVFCAGSCVRIRQRTQSGFNGNGAPTMVSAQETVPETAQEHPRTHQFVPQAGFGVFWAMFDDRNHYERLLGPQTNIRAQVQACVRACEQALEAGISHLRIHTDSLFTFTAMTRWIDIWKENGWILYDKAPVRNQPDFKRLDRYVGALSQVEWVHIGHFDQNGNEIYIPEMDAAEWLAQQGAYSNYPIRRGYF